MMLCHFTSLSTSFKLYRWEGDYERVCAIKWWAEVLLQRDTNQGPRDSKMRSVHSANRNTVVYLRRQFLFRRWNRCCGKNLDDDRKIRKPNHVVSDWFALKMDILMASFQIILWRTYSTDVIIARQENSGLFRSFMLPEETGKMIRHN